MDKRIPGAEGRAPSTPSRLTRSRRPSASRSTDTWETTHGAFLCTMWLAILDGSQKDRKRIANGEMKEFSKGGIFHLSFFYPLLSFFFPFSIPFLSFFLSVSYPFAIPFYSYPFWFLALVNHCIICNNKKSLYRLFHFITDLKFKLHRKFSNTKYITFLRSLSLIVKEN